MAGKKGKSKKSKIPASLDEVAEIVRKIGEYQRKLAVIQNTADEQIESLKIQVAEQANPYREEIKRLFNAVFDFAEKRRKELTEKGKKKTIFLPTGTLSWRLTPLSVSIRDRDKVVKACEELGLDDFIRIKKEPDKEAMLKEPEKASQIEGVSISRREEFVVRPDEPGKEITKKVPLKRQTKKKRK